MTILLRIILSVAVLGGVIWLVAPQDLAEALRGMDPSWLALAVLALTLQIALSALRWRITAGALGNDLPRGWAVQEYGLSVAVNTFLPGGVMGDLARIARSRNLGWRNAAASVLIERLAGQVALGIVALGALAAWLGTARAVMIVAAGLVALLVADQVWPKLRPLLVRAWCAPGIWAAQLGLSLAILAVNLSGFWAAARAVGLSLPPAAAVTLVSLTLLAMLVPLTINGWGLREGVAAALWPLWGIGAAQAVAASMAFGLACMGAALIGVIPWLLRRGSAPV